MTSHDPEAPRHSPPITGLARGACVLAGMGSFTLGAIATFKTDNEIGTSAMLLIGGIASLIALLGRVPRIKVGENEIDPSEIYRAGVEDGAEVVAEAAAEAALEHDSAADVARAAASAASWSALRGAHTELSRLNHILQLPNGNMMATDRRTKYAVKTRRPRHTYYRSDGQKIAWQDEGDEIHWADDFKEDWNKKHPESPLA